MAIESVGSQSQAIQASVSGRVDTARVDEKETGKVEEKDVNQNNKDNNSAVQIKDSSRGTAIDITG